MAFILPRFASQSTLVNDKKNPSFRLIAIFIFKTNVSIREVGRAQDRGFCSRDIWVYFPIFGRLVQLLGWMFSAEYLYAILKREQI